MYTYSLPSMYRNDELRSLGKLLSICTGYRKQFAPATPMLICFLSFLLGFFLTAHAFSALPFAHRWGCNLVFTNGNEMLIESHPLSLLIALQLLIMYRRSKTRLANCRLYNSLRRGVHRGLNRKKTWIWSCDSNRRLKLWC